MMRPGVAGAALLSVRGPSGGPLGGTLVLDDVGLSASSSANGGAVNVAIGGVVRACAVVCPTPHVFFSFSPDSGCPGPVPPKRQERIPPPPLQSWLTAAPRRCGPTRGFVAQVTATDAVFHGCNASSYGGALMNRGTATLVDTSFRNNYGNQSGHVYNRSAILLLTLEAHRSTSWG